MIKPFAIFSPASLLARTDRILPQPALVQRSSEQCRHHTNSHDADAPANDMSTVEPPSPEDVWISRARPTFLYIMYAMILWAIPMGLVAAFSPSMAQAISTGTTSYLSALPQELYTLFGTGYLGYATLRQWGKVKGVER